MSDGGANSGQLQSFTIDQFAGALALCLGAVGSLLLVVWQSRCLCRCRIGLSDQCYIFDCSREPPLAETEAGAEDKDTPPKTTAKKEFGCTCRLRRPYFLINSHNRSTTVVTGVATIGEKLNVVCVCVDLLCSFLIENEVGMSTR